MQVFHIIHRLIHKEGVQKGICILVNIICYAAFRHISHFFLLWHNADSKKMTKKKTLDKGILQTFPLKKPGKIKKYKKGIDFIEKSGYNQYLL